MGVIYDPMADEMFWAIKGRGAWLERPGQDAQRLSASQTRTLTTAVVSMDAGYGRDVAAVDRYVRVQRALLLQRVRHVRVLGSCGLTMAYVAAGRLDACFEEGAWESNTGPKICK